MHVYWRKKIFFFIKMHDVIRDIALWIICKIDMKWESFFIHVDGLFEVPREVKRGEKDIIDRNGN